MEHTSKHKNYTGIIIAIIVLVAILIIISLVPNSPARRMMTDDQIPQNQMMTSDQTQGQMMNTSDDPEAIQSDINSSLETDMQTDDLGY